MNASGSASKVVKVTGKLMAGLLLLIVLILITVYVLRDTVLRLGASALLSPYGIRIDTVQGLTLSTSSLAIQSARFRAEGSDEANELHDLRLTYSPGELIKGRVEHIQLGSLKVASMSMQNPEQTTSKSMSPDAINLSQIIGTLQSLPVDSAIIEQLEISPLAAVFSLSLKSSAREINVEAISDLTAVTAQINWHDTDFVSSYFIPDERLAEHDFSGRALTGSLQIVDQQALATRFEFTLSDAGEHLLLDAAGEVQLASLMPLLYRYELLADTEQNLAGALYFSASLQEDSASTREQLLNTVVTLREDSFITADLPMFPNDPDATFQWRATQPISLTGTYQPSSAALELSVSAQQMAASLHTKTGDRQATLDIAELTLQCRSATQCNGHEETVIHLPALAVGEIEIQNVIAATSADLELAEGGLSVRLAQGSRLGADSVHGPDLAVIDANILVQEYLLVTISGENELTLESDGIELYLPALTAGSNTSQGAFKLSQLAITRPSADSDFQGTALLEARNLSSDLLPFILRKPELSSRLTLSDQSISIEGVLKAADRDIFTFQATHRLDIEAGQAKLNLPLQQFGEGSDSLSQLFFSFPYEADVVGGTLAANADIEWLTDENGAIQVSGPLHVAVMELSGFFEEMALLNLTTTLDGELSDTVNFISAPDLHLEADTFDPGLPIENIALDYSINMLAHTAEIKNVSANLFDGTIRSTGFVYDWQAAENVLDVEISRIDLSKVLTLGSYEGIQATGFISGHVPVRIAGSNVSVRDGSLYVEPPGGSIRYQSGTTDTGNPALDLVNQALSNYQYGVMNTSVSYLPNGDLNLGVTLQGQNPDMNQGQRINLNLNVSDNIPALLESLQASRNITDALERELESR